MSALAKALASLPVTSPWAIEPSALERVRDFLASAPEAAFSTRREEAPPAPPYSLADGGIAVIRFEGVVVKRETFWGRWFGGEAITTRTADAVKAALADGAAKQLLLVVDSPGGTVDGLQDLADCLFAARAVKPLTTYADASCLSAAYAIGCQASRLFAGRMARVGSLGIFSTLRDLSRLYRNEGIEVEIVRAGEAKGYGTAGTDITNDVVREVQRTVDQTYEAFVALVARGRGMDVAEARRLADGRVHMGESAKGLRLVDGLLSLDDLIGQLRQETETPTPSSVAVVTTPPPAPQTDITSRKGASGPGPVARKEDPMDEKAIEKLMEGLGGLTKSVESLTAKVGDVSARLEAVEKTATTASSGVESLNTERELEKVLATAREETRLTAGNESYLEPAIRSAYAKSPEAAKAFVEALPKLAKGSGDAASAIVPGSAAAAAAAGAPVRRSAHDHVGVAPQAFKADRMRVHGAALEYQANAEKAGNKVSYRDAVVAVTRRAAA